MPVINPPPHFLNSSDIKMLHGVRLVRLVGNPAERAAQHGRILASLSQEERNSLALTPLSRKNQLLIRKAAGKIPGMASIIEKFYDAFVLRQFLRLPKSYRTRLHPFMLASGISKKRLWLSLFQPDLLMHLATKAYGETRNQFLQGMPGCTTGAVEKNGEVFFLRNLDYPAAGYWEKWPTVFYHEPKDPNGQKYVSISSLGIHTPGLTGWNESGIIFSLHAHFSKKTNLKGVPIFFLGEDILEKARSFEEAVKLCREFKTIGSWAINLVSVQEKKGATIELSNQSLTVSPMNEDQVLAHSNAFSHEKFQKDEIYFSGAFYEDIQSRKASLEKELSACGKNPKLTDILSALGSHYDFQTGETRVFGNTVSVVTTIQSAVIHHSVSGVHPTTDLYLSVRDESPTAIGPYVRIPLRWEDAAKLDTAAPLTETKQMQSKEWDEGFLNATHAYHEAYVAWQVHGHGSKRSAEVTLSLLIQATEFQPKDPHLWAQRGYFELLNHQYKNARDCFQTALQFKTSPHLHAVMEYFLGASLDLLQEREKALELYQKIQDQAALDPKLRRRVQRRLNRPFRRGYCQKIEPDLQFVEPIQYP